MNHKVLSAVGEKVRGYRYSLRCKYVKEDTTKEALYHLDISKHRSNISDQMWVGLVDHFFSDKFQNGHFEEDNTLNSSMYGGGKENVQMHEQRDIEVIMNDIGSSKDVNNNTVMSHDQIEQLNPLHGLNMSSKSQMGKGHVTVPTKLENSMALGDEHVHANMNATSASVKQAYNNISRLIQVKN